MRIGSGDWNRLLDNAGRQGKGESVLNSAALAFALHALIEIARGQDRLQVEELEQLDGWRRALTQAVGEAFDGRWFCRAYADDGTTIGGSCDDRIFLDVQAWAVLARCGTERQRQMALDAALDRGDGTPGPRIISPPLPLTPPCPYTTHRLPPQQDWNGGVSPMVGAWLVWALAEQGKIEQAQQHWEQLACRRLICEAESPVDGRLTPHGFIPDSALSQHHVRPLGAHHIFGWQHLALAMIAGQPRNKPNA